jgi:hypothetical protein
MQAGERLLETLQIRDEVVAAVDFTELIAKLDARIERGLEVRTDLPRIEVGEGPLHGFHVLLRHRPPSISLWHAGRQSHGFQEYHPPFINGLTLPALRVAA